MLKYAVKNFCESIQIAIELFMVLIYCNRSSILVELLLSNDSATSFNCMTNSNYTYILTGIHFDKSMTLVQ